MARAGVRTGKPRPSDEGHPKKGCRDGGVFRNGNVVPEEDERTVRRAEADAEPRVGDGNEPEAPDPRRADQHVRPAGSKKFTGHRRAHQPGAGRCGAADRTSAGRGLSRLRSGAGHGRWKAPHRRRARKNCLAIGAGNGKRTPVLWTSRPGAHLRRAWRGPHSPERAAGTRIPQNDSQGCKAAGRRTCQTGAGTRGQAGAFLQGGLDALRLHRAGRFARRGIAAI